MEEGDSGTVAKQSNQEGSCSKFLNIVKFVARFLCLLVGLALIIVGAFLLSEVKYAGDSTVGFALAIYGFYCIVFGILSMLAEIRHRAIQGLMKYILFLTTYLGRCVFYVFVGVVVLPIQVPKVTYIGYVMGGILIGAGILNLLIFPFHHMQNKDRRGESA